MLNLLADNEIFRLLFKVIPVGIVLMDRHGYVQGLNPEGSRIFCVDFFDDDARYLGGELLRCVNAKEGCGLAAACKDCILRTSAMSAIAGQGTIRKKGKFYVTRDHNIEQFTLQVTAMPLTYKGNSVALVIIEDISLVTELSGLIPICSYCHSVRNEIGEWVNIAKYLQEHSEAELTHDYCPTCSEKVVRDRIKVRESLLK